jgi:hypothetical protein
MAKRKQTQNPEADIQFLEAHLAGTLKPVAPPREIVQRLSRRIQMPNRERITASFSEWSKLFLAFGSVVSGTLLIITIARALYYLSGRRG